jgi:hypothetical protein
MAWAPRPCTCNAQRAASWAAAGRDDQGPAMNNGWRRGRRPERHNQVPARRRGNWPGNRDQLPAWHRRHRSWHHGQVPATHSERRRGQRPARHDQVPGRRRGHRPGHHDQVPATKNERRREQRPRHHDQISLEPKRGRGKQLGQGPHTQKLGTNSDESPCCVATFVVNSKPHTAARSSVRLCVGPELFRCVNIYSSPLLICRAGLP